MILASSTCKKLSLDYVNRLYLNMMKNYALSVLMLLVLMSSCKKDKDADLSRTDLLTNKPWRLISEVETASNSNNSKDNFQALDTCQKDDLTIFKRDNTVTYEEGPTKCSANDPQVFATGTWAFINDESRILYSIPGFNSYEEEIIELTSDRMVLRYAEEDRGVTYFLTSTYVAQ